MTTLPLYRPSIQTMEGPSAPHAFTARPDLWPPGSKAQGGPAGMGPPWAWWYYSWSYAGQRSRDAVRAGRDLPGAAEAAILAGQVEVTWSNLEWGAE